MSSKKDNKKTRNRKYYREVQENLYRCRDLEISNLWQRSIFVSSIVILCYTGYGVLFSKAFENADVVVKIGSGERELFRITNDYSSLLGDFHLYLGIICVIGVVFSVMYVLMAKASKAWQEAYENAILDLERNTLYHNLDYSGNGILDEENKAGWWMGSYLNLERDKVDDHIIISTNAGYFSPSRINILLGVMSCWIFIAISTIHFTCYLYNHMDYFCNQIDYIGDHICNVVNKLLIVILILIFVVCFWFLLFNWGYCYLESKVTSSHLPFRVRGKKLDLDNITPTDSEVDVSVDVSINDNSETSNNRKH